MNVLVLHNRYAYAGGEDEAFASEVALLRKYGHSVFTFMQDNRDLAQLSQWSAGVRSVWSKADYHAVRRLIRENGIEILSVHNFFPMLSPSVYYAARAEGIPAVQTLHNYRLLCPAATFLRDGAVCEECLGKALPWPAAAHRCYRGSMAQTGVLAGMLTIHKMMGTWRNLVSRYIALTPFMREKFIAAGFSPEQVVVKPNSVEDLGMGNGEAGDFVFVGRLSGEKGVSVLLKAWSLASTTRKLKIIGTGPEDMSLRAYAASLRNVEFMGQLPLERARQEVGRATALVFPSTWYEGLSRVILEAFSSGTPVIASDIGPLPEIVQDGVNGRLFPVKDAAALAARLTEFSGDGAAGAAMRAAARRTYEARYSDEVVYPQLEEIYRTAIEEQRLK